MAVSLVLTVILTDGIVIQSSGKQKPESYKNATGGSYTENDPDDITVYAMQYSEYVSN